MGTTFALKAIAADGSPYPLPELVSSRGARRVAFLGGEGRQLTALGRGFTIGDFDICLDGREHLFDRSDDESDVVLIERPK